MDPISASRKLVKACDHTAVEGFQRPDGAWFLDFGTAWFGTLVTAVPQGFRLPLEVELGEVLAGAGQLDPAPGGTRRYRRLSWPPGDDLLSIPPDRRNTTPPAVLVPEGMPEVMPIRAVVIHGWPAESGNPLEHLRLRALAWPFAHQGSWHAGVPVLDEVDRLCRHTMEATSFLGIYVDGDRERIAYEGDALINMWGHFACDANSLMAGATIEHLLRHPTWPAEWHLQIACCAWEYLLASGDYTLWLRHAAALEAHGLGQLQRDDGWLHTGKGPQDAAFLASIAMSEPISYLIDWPIPERDGSDEGHLLTAVNAWFVRSQDELAKGLAACGLTSGAAMSAARRVLSCCHFT